MPIPEKANSLILLRPLTTAPPVRCLDELAACGLALGKLLRERGDRTEDDFGHGALPWRLALHGLVVIVHLEQKATRFRLERPVERSRRAARIRIGTEARPAFAVPVVADDQIARDEIHLFPVVVHERLGRMHAGGEAQMSRAETTLVLLVEESRKNLLPDPVGITRQFFPAAVEVDFVELLVFFLDCHVVSC